MRLPLDCSQSVWQCKKQLWGSLVRNYQRIHHGDGLHNVQVYFLRPFIIKLSDSLANFSDHTSPEWNRITLYDCKNTTCCPKPTTVPKKPTVWRFSDLFEIVFVASLRCEFCVKSICWCQTRRWLHWLANCNLQVWFFHMWIYIFNISDKDSTDSKSNKIAQNLAYSSEQKQVRF